MRVLLAFVLLSLCSVVSATNAVAHEERGIGCTVCTLIIGYAEDYLGSNATLAEIETFLNTTVCGLLPSFLQGECAALVDEYAPVIAQRIFQGFPASVICQDIGLCSAKAANKPVAVVPVAVKPVAVAPPQGGIACTVCTLLVGYAEDYLGSNATLAEIETFLNTTVCGLLPSFLQGECASLVDQYAPQIAQKIFQGFPASVVCQDVGLCSSRIGFSVAAVSAHKLPQTQNGVVCTVCTLIVGYAEDYLGSNATLAQIETFLNSTVCGLLPSFLQGECASLVDQYAPQIAQKIFQGFPASVVCQDVGLCSSPKPVAVNFRPNAFRTLVQVKKAVLKNAKKI